MKVLAFSFGEKTALTYNKETGAVELWTAEYASNSKVFSKEIDGEIVKALLSSDGGYAWKRYAQKTQYCEYHQFWFGEFLTALGVGLSGSA